MRIEVDVQGNSLSFIGLNFGLRLYLFVHNVEDDGKVGNCHAVERNCRTRSIYWL